MITRAGSVFDLGASTFDDLIKERIDGLKKEEIRIALPAVIKDISNYESQQCVSVQASINDIYPSDGLISIPPIIKGVYVKLQGGNNFRIKIPVEVGDPCTLYWSHRSLTKFLNGKGGSVNVSIDHLPQMRDCWVELGFGTRSNNYSPSATDFIIEGNNYTFTIKQNGDFSVISSGNGNLKATKYTIDCPVEMTETLNVAKSITSGTDISAGQSVSAPNISASSSMQISGTEVKDHFHRLSGGGQTLNLGE